MYSSKTHGYGDKPQIITIMSTKQSVGNRSGKDNILCPYYVLQHYVKIHPECSHINQPFFVFRDGSAVKPAHMRQALKLNLQLAGFDQKLYDTHSLRIGAVTSLLDRGISVETIKKLGRWKSNCV